MTKGIIQINLVDGAKINYVRDTVNDTNGKNGEYYGWDESTVGDTFADQTDSAGKIIYDFNTLKTNLTAMGSFIEFPEATPTEVLTRRNQNSTLDKNDTVYLSVLKSQVVSVSLRTSIIEDYATFITRSEA